MWKIARSQAWSLCAMVTQSRGREGRLLVLFLNIARSDIYESPLGDAECRDFSPDLSRVASERTARRFKTSRQMCKRLSKKWNLLEREEHATPSDYKCNGSNALSVLKAVSSLA